jgi:hypothetical protein
LSTAASLGVTAAPGWAGTLRPTTTVLTTSADAIDAAQSAEIIATIHPGLFALPFGTVTFTDKTNGAALGTARPASGCLYGRQACTAIISISGASLTAGANEIIGRYSGDAADAGSEGSVYVYRGTGATCAAGYFDPCGNGFSSPGGTASAYIFTFTPPSGTEVEVAAFGPEALPCTTPDTGPTLAFNVTNAGSYKTIDFTIFGTYADVSYAAHPDGYICYESPSTFTTAADVPATKEADGMYYGVLPQCFGEGEDEAASNEPCEDGSYYNPASPGSPSSFDQTFETAASDPRATN